MAARLVVFTWDPGWDRVLWVVEEYVPEIRELERSRFPPIDQVVDVIGAHCRSRCSWWAVTSVPTSDIQPDAPGHSNKMRGEEYARSLRAGPCSRP